MATTHTPAPWNACVYGGWGTPRVFSESGSIAMIQHHESGPGEGEANTRLIAAAPELLESLRQAVSSLEYLFVRYGAPEGENSEMMKKARAAIAKATGEVKS